MSPKHTNLMKSVDSASFQALNKYIVRYTCECPDFKGDFHCYRLTILHFTCVRTGHVITSIHQVRLFIKPGAPCTKEPNGRNSGIQLETKNV